MPRTNDERETTKAPCRACLSWTFHAIEGTCIKQDHDYDGDGIPVYSWSTTFELLRCMGCHTGSLRTTTVEDADPEPGYKYYPPPVSRQAPSWRMELPTGIRELLAEVYEALHAGHKRLAMMGSRTLVDLTVVQTVGDVGHFQAKLERLRNDQHITSRQEKVLLTAFDAGSAAAHRGFNPTLDNVNAVLDIVENLLQSRFVLTQQSKQLKKATPKRKRK